MTTRLVGVVLSVICGVPVTKTDSLKVTWMGITAPVKIIVFRVGSMDNRFACEHACHDAPRSGWSRTASKLGKGDRRSPNGYSTHPLALGNYKFTE